MAPLARDPTALDRAGATVLTTGVSLGSVISTLTTALAGTAGMAGDDPVGAAPTLMNSASLLKMNIESSLKTKTVN